MMREQCLIDLCTGCSACVNICPNSALNIIKDKNGFYKVSKSEEKCTHCNKCIDICPINNKKVNSNEKRPALFVFNNKNDYEKLSATAGGFQIIAKQFLAEKGKVVGAVWDKNWICKHVIVDNETDLQLLYKSKYVQSYMGDIFKQTKNELDNGVKILFSGLPCQIAGLYNYLGKEYENLYTIDLLCNNAPSIKHFHNFLNSEYGIDNIKKVDFRAKEENQETSRQVLKIITNDNEEHLHECWSDNSYYQAFVMRMLAGKHCENCQFAKIPRLADITLGDIFGAEKYKPEYRGLKTQSVLINSVKGLYLFDLLKNKINTVEEIPLRTIIDMHPALERKWNVHPLRDRMFDLLQKYPIKEAFKYVTEQKFDVGIVGVPTNPNYGGALTYLALKYVLEDLNKTVLMISPPGDNYAWLPKEITNFKNNPYKDYEIVSYNTKTEMKKLNDCCEMFLVGSDQLFSTHFYNFGIYNEMDKFSSLDWVIDSKKKVAYSASFGHDELICSPEIKNHMHYFLKKFDEFTVREKSAINLCKKEFDIDATFVLDPVFLCNKNHYMNLITLQKPTNSIFTYILDKNEDTQNIVDYLQKTLSKNIDNVDDVLCNNEHKIPVEDWISKLYNSDFVITDSFHAMCFSIIFNKPFLVIENSNRGKARFKLLEEFGLQSKIVNSYNDFEIRKNEILQDINWETVNSKFDELKESSFSILKNILEPKKKNISTYDILDKKIDNVVSQMKLQEQKIKNLSNQFHIYKEFSNKKIQPNKLYDIYISVHDQDLILKLEENNIFRNIHNYKYLFLGMRPTDKLEHLKDKVVIARNLKDNIEHQKCLFDYTGWYALVKNNLINNDYVVVVHYDCLLFKNFEKTIKKAITKKPNSFINFQPHSLTANYFINDLFAKSALEACHTIYNLDMQEQVNEAIKQGDKYWPAGGSFACSKQWLQSYIEWVEPMKNIIMKDKMASHNIERLFKFFNLVFDIEEQHIPDIMEHIYNCSHDQKYHQSNSVELKFKKKFAKYIEGKLFKEYKFRKFKNLIKKIKLITRVMTIR